MTSNADKKSNTQKNELQFAQAETNFVTAKEAAKYVSYSPDYIARLAREGKVTAVQKNNRWFVSLEALKLFSLQQQAETRARQEELKQARLAEYARTQLAARSHGSNVNSWQMVLPALAVTAAICLCLVLVGVLGLAGFRAGVQPAQLQQGFESVKQLVQQVVPFSFNSSDDATPSLEASAVRITESGVMVRDDATVAEVFSDPTSVEVQDTSTIILTPVFSSAADEKYVIELVPVNASSSEDKERDSISAYE